MAKANSVDATLEIVKDLDKFKARIKELAAAEVAAENSTKKAKARNGALNLAHDKAVAAHQDTLKSMSAHMKSMEKSANDAMKPVTEAKADVVKATAALAKREDKLAEGEKSLAKNIAELAGRITTHRSVAREFEAVITAAVKGLNS
jgi:hypothetical protein